MSKEIYLANWDGEKFIDRLYQSFDKSIYMIQADGSTYYGAIKTITTKGKFGMTQVSFTEDNRWFDRSGKPIPKPDHIDSKSEIKKLKAEIKQKELDHKFTALKHKINGG